MIRSLVIVLSFLAVQSANAQQFYNVLNYGAKNDSSKLSTKAIATAI